MPGKVRTNRAGNRRRVVDVAAAPSTPPEPSQIVKKSSEPSYYDVPMLKAPVWKWEIANYFFFGGMSAGSYLIARAAGRFGGEKFGDVARVGAWTAFASFLPCPPLLIHDLGDPKRFHHMLRVFKPTSPMSLGTWAIMGYSGAATVEVVRQYLNDNRRRLDSKAIDQLTKLMNSGTVLLVNDAMGVPFALLVAGYTGVLLSCTANPLWSKNPWLGPLFSASALATGAEAIGLALNVSRRRDDSRSQASLSIIDTVAHGIELACLAGLHRHAGDKAKPITHGKMASYHRFSIGAIVLAEVLKLIPLRGRAQKLKRIICSLLGLAGGYSMRWSFVYGGREAAADPSANRLASKPAQHSRLTVRQ